MIKLQTDSLLHVPFQKYEKDFTFIVNSEKYETSSFFADLLSPLISTRHLTDPTIKEFVINTKTPGDFNKIIELINFQEHNFDTKETTFFIEVLDQLRTENIFIESEALTTEISNENVIELIKDHQLHPQFYKAQLKKEIDYISKHFFEMSEQILNSIKNDDDKGLKYYVIEDVIKNQELHLETEDQLLNFINELYSKNKKYSSLYEFVIFRNVEVESIKEFINIFDDNDLTRSTWLSICDRLQQKIIEKDEEKKNDDRIHKYSQKCFIEMKTKEKEFDGILNYLQTHSNIKDEINITASSQYDGDLFNLLQYDNLGSYFCTNDEKNSWICFEFKKHQIIPSSYIIRSHNSENNFHPKTWILEGSTDNEKWTTLDEQKNNDFLKGTSRVHSFNISNSNHNQQSFKYLRIHQTGPNWYYNNDSYHHLLMNAIEFYGQLI